MYTELKVSQNLSVEIKIEDGMVYVTTNNMGRLRTTYYDCIEDAMDMTSLPSVHEYLKSIYATN